MCQSVPPNTHAYVRESDCSWQKSGDHGGEGRLASGCHCDTKPPRVKHPRWVSFHRSAGTPCSSGDKPSLTAIWWEGRHALTPPSAQQLVRLSSGRKAIRSSVNASNSHSCRLKTQRVTYIHYYYPKHSSDTTILRCFLTNKAHCFLFCTLKGGEYLSPLCSSLLCLHCCCHTDALAQLPKPCSEWAACGMNASQLLCKKPFP